MVLERLLRKLNLAASSYYYHHRRLHREDRLQSTKEQIKELFENSHHTYGYRRIWYSLKNHGIRISEKVVRRIMSEYSLKPKMKTVRKYSSYQGEITPAPDNLLQRDFHADHPNEKWLTDITEMAAADGKAYLSPILDCFDGFVVSWNIGYHPNAELTTECSKKE